MMPGIGTTVGLIKSLAKVNPEDIESSVNDWLDDHPEATTTVEDGSVTKAKLYSDLADQIDASTSGVSALNSAINDQSEEIYNIETLLNIPTEAHFSGTSTASWTTITIGSLDLKNGVTYNFDFRLSSALEYVVFAYVKDENNNNLVDSIQIAIGDTYRRIPYTCEQNGKKAVFKFQVGVSTSTTVNVDVTTNEVSKIKEIEDDISDIQEDITEISGDLSDLSGTVSAMDDDVSYAKAGVQIVTEDVAIVVDITSIANETGKQATYNPQYNKIAFQNTQYINSYVYSVSEGDKVILKGYGNNTTAGTFAAVGDADIITSGAANCNLLQVIAPDSSELGTHVVEATITYTGYLYLNIAANGTGYAKKDVTVTAAKTDKTLLLANVPADAQAVGQALKKTGVIKNANAYTYVYPDGNAYIGITFKSFGPNSILDWYSLAYGSFDGLSFTATKTIFEAYTDLTGPYSIAQNQSQSSLWAGGNHSKTISDVACPTAEQTTLHVYVNGTDISSENDGFYEGTMSIETVNIIYFPQTITDAIFTDAVQAIKEKRRYTVDDGVHVQVLSQMLDDVYISLYHGMQLQSAWASKFIVPSSDTELNKTDIATDMGYTDIGHVLIAQSDDARIKMIMSDDGIGTFKYNTASDKNKNSFMSNGAKCYFDLVRLTNMTEGKVLYWDGFYQVSKK